MSNATAEPAWWLPQLSELEWRQLYEGRFPPRVDCDVAGCDKPAVAAEGKTGDAPTPSREAHFCQRHWSQVAAGQYRVEPVLGGQVVLYEEQARHWAGLSDKRVKRWR